MVPGLKKLARVNLKPVAEENSLNTDLKLGLFT